MLNPATFFETLQRKGVRFYTGVPDSLLKHFCAYVTNHTAAGQHVIAANEGAAIAIAAGYYLATGQVPLVYMQNSGQGNAINPLTSLAAPDIFGIPMVLLVGWRGEPGVPDEPQHVRQGRCTTAVFDAIGLPHSILPREEAAAADLLGIAIDEARAECTPYGLIVRDKTFTPGPAVGAAPIAGASSREDALRTLVASIPMDAAVVCTTGMASRELDEIRRASGGGAGDLRVVGSMGHASQIALGIALAQPARPVVCIDGDGAVLMHMGSLAVIGAMRPRNLIHVVLNNGAHDSVGGQPTAGLTSDLCAVAAACGYAVAERVTAAAGAGRLGSREKASGPSFFEVLVTPGARADLGRPIESPALNRQRLMDFLAAGALA